MAVPQTVVVSQTVEVPVTVVVTSTPRPTLAPTATPTQPPKPAVEIPNNWLTYEDPVGMFTLRYPPVWSVDSQNEGYAYFRMPSYAGIGVSVATPAIDQPVTVDSFTGELAVNDTVRYALSQVDRNESVKVVSKGEWTHSVQGTYVELSVYNSIYESTSRRVHVIVPTDGGQALFAWIYRASGVISEAEKEDAGRLLASYQARQ